MRRERLRHYGEGTDASGNGQARDFCREFVCPEESSPYSASLEQLVFGRIRKEGKQGAVVVELGSGRGEPVVVAIMNSGFRGVVRGYEMNAAAAARSAKLISQFGLAAHFVVHNKSFFDGGKARRADYMISNPPYLPCRDRKLLLLPELCGGPEGNTVSRGVLTYAHEEGCPNVFLEMSSYSNPRAVVEHAACLGFRVADFKISRMPMGPYSRQEVVKERLEEVKREGKAHFSEDCYLVGSALFTRAATGEPDLSEEFLGCLTSIGKRKSGLEL